MQYIAVMTLNNGTENVELLLFRTVAILGASLWIGYWHGYSALLELFDGIGCIGTRGSNLVGALAAPPPW